MSQLSAAGPEDALQRQIEIAQYVCAGSAAVYIWDILNHIRSEYTLLFRHKSSVAMVAYFMSRIGGLVFVLGFTVFASYPFKNCTKPLLVFTSFLPLAVSGTCFLFSSRVSALWSGHRIVTPLFASLSLAATGSSVLVPLGESAMTFPFGEVGCVVSRVEAYVGAAVILLMVQNAGAFGAIAYRMISNLSHGERQGGGGGKPDRDGALARGAAVLLPALFADGQMYYLITVLTNLTATLLFYLPRVPPLYHALLVVPNITVTSVMACRVYRTRIIGPRRPSQLTLPTLNCTSGEGGTMAMSAVRFRERTDGTGSQMDGDELKFARGSVPESSLGPSSRSKSDGSYPSDARLDVGVSG
ncbi:hypothetical protein B0H12DRAFT_1118054 [Mycena haematopus]|nr:hypothetical protein B0H12DRAFT_1118054 [Mycena haematopus]